jgi:hypothetical protein
MADDLSFIRPTQGISDQRGGTRRFARRRVPRSDGAGLLDEDSASFEPTSVPAPDPTQPLLEALDRMRVTGEVRPAEQEYTSAIRALREYEETTRSFLPDEPNDAPPQSDAT